MKYAQAVTYKGQQIWCLDAANKGEKEVLEGWEEAKQVLAAHKDGCLAVIDARNMPMTAAILNTAKETAAMARGDPRIRVAFVGLTGMAKSMAQIHAATRHVNARFVDTVEEAKEWLISEAEKPRKGQGGHRPLQ